MIDPRDDYPDWMAGVVIAAYFVVIPAAILFLHHIVPPIWAWLVSHVHWTFLGA
jgi:hypothetical protein